MTTTTAALLPTQSTTTVEAEGVSAFASMAFLTGSGEVVPSKPRNVQRMTIAVRVDVDMAAFEETFEVKGWSPTRAELAKQVLLVLQANEDLAGASASIKTK